MFTGSVCLQGLQINYPSSSSAAPQAAAAVVEPSPTLSEPDAALQPSQGFVWAVAGSDLGSHTFNYRLATTLSATFQGQKVSDYALQAGTLPPDITLNPTSGVLIGTLSATGSYVFTIRARAQGALSDATYSLTVHD